MRYAVSENDLAKGTVWALGSCKHIKYCLVSWQVISAVRKNVSLTAVDGQPELKVRATSMPVHNW